MGQPDQRSQHTDIENNRFPNILHYGLIQGKLHLPGIHFALGLHMPAVGNHKPAGSDDTAVFVVSLLGQADQHIRLKHLWKINLGIGYNHIGTGCSAARFRTVYLGLHGYQDGLTFPFNVAVVSLTFEAGFVTAVGAADTGLSK